MALLDGFTRIYHDLTRSLYVAVEDDIIRLVKEDSAIGDSTDDPKAYEEAQGWFGDFEEKFSGMDEKAIVAWMKNGYGHRDGLEKFTEFCANRNNSTVSNIFYD